MPEKSLPQGNPTLDKMAKRLGLAGAGVLGPILKGLGGRVSVTIGRDEDLISVRIHSPVGSFNQLLSGDFTSLGDGRRRWDCDIVFGDDTAYGLTGGDAARNYLEWVIRKLEIENVVEEPIDFDVPLDRSYFSVDRDYSLEVLSNLTSTDFSNPVAAVWRDDLKELYVLGSDSIKIVNRAGIMTRASIVSLPADPFFAPAGIVFLGGQRFAILNEGATDRSPTIVLFHIIDDELVVFDDDVVYHLDGVDETYGRCKGFAYDPWRNKYYVGTESIQDGEGGLYEIDLTTADTDYSCSTTLLYNWWDTLVSTDGVAPGALLGGLYYSRTLSAGAANDSLFAVFHTGAGGGPTEERVVVQFDIQSGAVISSYNYPFEGVVRGIVFSEYNENFFLFAPVSGTNFWRFSHTAFTETVTFTRQFFVKDIPSFGGVYFAGQEAQLGEAIIFINKESPSKPQEEDATFGINILPTFSDEFFKQHEYSGNRYAQTLRNWGGAETVEVWSSGHCLIPEMDIADLDGYFWDDPDYGLHVVYIYLRASQGSEHVVTIVGFIRFRQFDCPEEEE